MSDLISDSTSDLIRREDAIRVASGFCHPANIAKELAKLPSAEPNLQPTCNQLATDCISRSAALDVIRNIRAIAGSYDSEMLLIDKAEAQTELMMMPSAQPERKKDIIDGLHGEPNSERLILYRNKYNEQGLLVGTEAIEERKPGQWHGTVCSVCGESTPFYFDCKYCPSCGAKMEGGD